MKNSERESFPFFLLSITCFILGSAGSTGNYDESHAFLRLKNIIIIKSIIKV